MISFARRRAISLERFLMMRCLEVPFWPNTNWKGELRRTTLWMFSRTVLCVSALVIACCFLGAAAHGQDAPGPGAKPATAMPSVLEVPLAAQPSDHFDAVAATNAYLAQIPEEARSRSDAYFEGGYWLILWDFLCGAIINFLFLQFRWSASMRNAAERATRFSPLQTLIYWTQFLVVSTVLGFPLAVYEGYSREHKYGLATQTLGPWLGDQAKALLVGLSIGGIAIMLLLGVVRRLPRTWWIWGAVAAIVFMAFLVLISPVYLFPIFNTIKPLDDARITDPILRMAHANGIAVDKVFEIDASRQSTRMSANVSGLGDTMRITLNDNLLRRGSLPEIQFVMGHEMGHYVLHHILKDMIFFFVVIVAAFGFLRWSVEWALKRWGERWQIRGITDVAVLPLVFLMGSIFFFVLTPILNTQTRTNEGEADMYGLNASRQPDGAAQAAIHLGEYRKMNPGPVEEFFFFDHPSGRNRIFAAMRWKAQNLQLFTSPSEPRTKVTPSGS
jgi:STE24 endopeptidase